MPGHRSHRRPGSGGSGQHRPPRCPGARRRGAARYGPPHARPPHRRAWSRRPRPQGPRALRPPRRLAVRRRDLLSGAVLPRSAGHVRGDDPRAGSLVGQRRSARSRVGDRRPARSVPAGAAKLDSLITSVPSPWSLAGLVALGLALWGATGVMSSMQKTLAVVFDDGASREPRPRATREWAARARRPGADPVRADRLDARERRAEGERERGRGSRLAAVRVRHRPRRRRPSRVDVPRVRAALPSPSPQPPRLAGRASRRWRRRARVPGRAGRSRLVPLRARPTSPRCTGRRAPSSRSSSRST